jgi:hypothetical protein
MRGSTIDPRFRVIMSRRGDFWQENSHNPQFFSGGCIASVGQNLSNTPTKELAKLPAEMRNTQVSEEISLLFAVKRPYH